MTTLCSKCGSSLAADVSFCPQCGTSTTSYHSDSGTPMYDSTVISSHSSASLHTPATGSDSSPYELQNPYEPFNPYAVPPPPPAPKRQDKNSMLIGMLIGIIVTVLLLVSVSAFVWLTKDAKNTPSGNTSLPTVTKIPTSVTATSTAKVGENPYPPYRGTLVLNDPLRNQSGGWSEYPVNTAGAACQFAQDGYHASEQQNYILGCFNTMRFNNFTFEVQMKVTNGNCGGISFDQTQTWTSAYHFEVCQDGAYSLVHYDSSHPTILLSGRSASIRHGLNQNNTIAVVAIGYEINLYVNGQTIGSISDSKRQQGIIGLLAHYDNSPVEIVYSDVKAWTL